MKSLTDKTIAGLNWNIARNNSNAIINIAIGILLARLLVPQDFGLVGMTVIFTGLADLFVTLGMGSSIIRIKDTTEEHIKTATTVTILASVIIYILFWFAAPFIAEFYKEPRIIKILRVLAVLFVIKGITTISSARLMKELNFKYLLIIDASSSTIGVGILGSTLAILGFGVWSLVFGRIAAAIISSLLTLLKEPVKMDFVIRKKEFKDLVGFGTGVSLSKILQYAGANIDYIMIGKFLNSYMLGLYTRAFNLMTESVNKVTGGMYDVLFPAYAAAQNDTEKLRRAYLRTIRTISYFLFPILASMIVAAEYIIKGLFGVKWAGAITSFQILALAGLLRTTTIYAGAIAHATGRVFTEVKQQLVYFLTLGICAFFGVRFGIEGVATAVVIAYLWKGLAQNWLALKIIEANWKDFFKVLLPGFSNLLLMVINNLILISLLEKFLPKSPYELKLGITVIVNFVVFLCVLLFVPYSIKGDTLNWLIDKYKRYIPNFIVKFYFSFNIQK